MKNPAQDQFISSENKACPRKKTKINTVKFNSKILGFNQEPN